METREVRWVSVCIALKSREASLNSTRHNWFWLNTNTKQMQMQNKCRKQTEGEDWLTTIYLVNGQHTHTRLTALFPGLPGWAGTREVKPISISLKQETVSGSGISWAICKSAPSSQTDNHASPHHSIFYRPDALPAMLPTVPKHWRPEGRWRKAAVAVSSRITSKHDRLLTRSCSTSWRALTSVSRGTEHYRTCT